MEDLIIEKESLKEQHEASQLAQRKKIEQLELERDVLKEKLVEIEHVQKRKIEALESERNALREQSNYLQRSLDDIKYLLLALLTLRSRTLNFEVIKEEMTKLKRQLEREMKNKNDELFEKLTRELKEVETRVPIAEPPLASSINSSIPKKKQSLGSPFARLISPPLQSNLGKSQLFASKVIRATAKPISAVERGSRFVGNSLSNFIKEFTLKKFCNL